MDLREVLAAFRRHVWLLLLVTAIAVSGSVYLAAMVGPRYEISADVVMLPPRSAVPEGSNPLLVMGDLGQAVDVTVLAATDDDVHDRLVRQGAVESFEIVADRTTSAPIIKVTTTARTASGARTTTEIVARAIPDIVRSVQNDLQRAPEEYITARVLRVQQDADVSRKRQVQVGLAAFAFLTFLAVAFVMAVDAAGARRARRRPRDAAASEDDGLPPAHDRTPGGDADGDDTRLMSGMSASGQRS